MRDLASVQKIIKIEPIQGKDRIELATILGWKVIIEKGKYKEGDLVVYIEYDTILPEKPEFEFLRKRCWSKLYQGFRIRNMAMAGVYSQGIVFSLDILNKKSSPIRIYKEGENVAYLIGVKKYDLEELKSFRDMQSNNKYSPFKKWFFKYKIFRWLFLRKKTYTLPYPATVKKSGETNIQICFNFLKALGNIKFYVSEKLEGQAATYLLLKKNIWKKEYMVYSHNAYISSKEKNNWNEISKKYNIEKILREYSKEKNLNLAVQGEIIGEKIQGNIYGIKGKDFYVYKVTDTDTGRAFNFEHLYDFCFLNALKMVPSLQIGTSLKDSVEDMLEYSDGFSVINPRVKREGVVWRSMTNQAIGCKVKSREYSIWFEKHHGKTE